MPHPYRSREKQVSLTIFDNEPLARLAEQRLRQEGIPCLIRSLQGGPGLWGSAYNLPHAIYVYESDEMRAREVLDLIPLELVERERAAAGPRRQPRVWLIMLIIGIVLALIMAAPSLATLFR
jgi:hypothetical protein